MDRVVKISDAIYPELLKKIASPPQEIYYKGKWDNLIFKKCLAVVGARKMTSYGKQITTKLVSEIAAAGITIVSGFMYGVDATAHKAALAGGGKTIAVMPCGIDIIHPPQQKNLYREILDKEGLIISEFEAKFPPALWTYPKRNRIVAGLSETTLVVEAGRESGSLITADLARKYKRKVFAVPGPLTSIVSEGALQLIKNGAGLVTESNDILAYYGVTNIKSRQNTSQFPTLTNLERSIVKELDQEPRDIDQLTRAIKTTASELGATLSFMELKGLLFEENGKYYIKVG